jgi:hypothetical protein
MLKLSLEREVPNLVVRNHDLGSIRLGVGAGELLKSSCQVLVRKDIYNKRNRELPLPQRR